MDTRFEHDLAPNCVLILQPRKIFHLALSKEHVCVYSKHQNWVIQLRTSPWNGKGITSLHETKDLTANTFRVMPNDSSSLYSIIEEYIHLHTYSKIKTHTHEIWSLPGILSMARGHFCEAAQNSDSTVSWVKSARVGNALVLGQCLAIVLLLNDLALPWGRFLLDPDAVPISQIRI